MTAVRSAAQRNPDLDAPQAPAPGRKRMRMMQKIDTICVQGGWQPKVGEPRVLPIYQSTTFKYDTAEQLGDLFDLKTAGHFYTRLSNPTLEAVEQKIAALEGGVGAMLTASGQAATSAAVLTLCGAGDHIVSTSAVYGGTFNLLDVSLRKLGIETTFLSPDASEEEIEAAIRPNTKLVFGEVLSNPSLCVLDIARFARVAHRNRLPLFVDNTFPTSVGCRPIEHGADVVLHSPSKYMDGHAVSLGGVIIDAGTFDWAASGRHPGLCEPDASYHGVVYTEQFGPAAFLCKARTQIMRDYGAQMSPQNAFLLNLGLETLALRMERHSANGLAVARFLHDHEKVAWVNYPGLTDSPYYALAQQYLPRGASGVVSFGVRGGREAAARVMERLQLAAIVTHVADARTSVIHPASTTHRQMTDEQLTAAGVTPDLIRLSVGIEHPDDIIADLAQALDTL